MLKIEQVRSKKDLKAYINFPYELYKNDAIYTPPLKLDEWSYYNPKKNPNLKNDYILFLAKRDGKVVGRIMGLINHEANQIRGEEYCRFSWLDCEDDWQVFEHLIKAVEDWGKSKGMKFLVGPRGFSDQDPQGALVEGFDSLVAIGTIYTREYFDKRISQFGFSKDADWVSYKFYVPEIIPMLENVKMTGLVPGVENQGIKNFKSKKELKKYIIPLFELLNDVYKKLYGFHPMNEEEMKTLAAKYMPVINPRFVKFYMVEDKIAAFSIAMPDVTVGLKKAQGKLLPLGWFHILKAMKEAKTIQYLLIGIDPKYQHQGLMFPLLKANHEEVKKTNMKTVDTHLNLEENKAIRRWIKMLKGDVYRRYRVYRKEI